ncbi:hypothetical protein P692DRAFT_201670892, partial [Suillus brevipes Sb2]
MSTLNASTGYTNFHLHLGRSPRLIPPLITEHIQSAHNDFPTDIANVLDTIVALKMDIADAHDALLMSKDNQAHHASNMHRSPEPTLLMDLVYLSMAHRRQEYLNGDNKRVAK